MINNRLDFNCQNNNTKFRLKKRWKDNMGKKI